MRRENVLVLGEDTRSFLAIVRSLGRKNVRVHAAPANFRSPALRSRYIERVHYLPLWQCDGEEWLEAMETLLRAGQFDLVIPCNETTLLPLHHHRARFEALTRLAIPDARAIAVLFDKHETRELAVSLGIPVSRGGLPNGEPARQVFETLGAPVVVKPRRSFALESLSRRGKVQICRTEAELAPLLAEIHPDDSLLEAFFPGRGLGVSLLASQGKVLQAFEHHRVRETSSGASYYRVSAPLSPDLLQACADIVAALSYTGVGMFEFRRNPQNGAWVLLEVNARPWGSQPLPVGLGVDFPYRWFRLLTAGEETGPLPYPVGVYGRNLVPDLLATMHEAAARRRRPARMLWLLAGRFAELGRLLTGRDIQDVFVRDDPRPALAELGAIARRTAGRIGGALPGAAAFQRRRERARLGAALRRAADGGNLRILFVCQGNICRSPFAEAALKQIPGIAARIADTGAIVGSAGMIPRPGRNTPAPGIAAARAVGIDLTAHRSAHLSRAQADTATVIVIFDEVNRQAVLERYPDTADRLVKLGNLAEDGPAITDIADPIDRDLAFYTATYRNIGRGVAGLAAAIRRMG